MSDEKILNFPKSHFQRERQRWKDIEEMLCDCADEVTVKPKGLEGGNITHAAVILVNDEGNALFRTFAMDAEELVDIAAEYEWECFQRGTERDG